MKMRILSFETEISFCDDYVEVLQIEEQKLFGSLVNSIYRLSNGIEEGIAEQIVLLEEEKIIDMLMAYMHWNLRNWMPFRLYFTMCV